MSDTPRYALHFWTMAVMGGLGEDRVSPDGTVFTYLSTTLVDVTLFPELGESNVKYVRIWSESWSESDPYGRNACCEPVDSIPPEDEPCPNPKSPG